MSVEIMPARTPANDKRILLVGTAVCVVAVSVFAAQTLIELHELWVDTFTYSHGYLVALLAAWLAFRVRGRFRLGAAAPSAAGLAALAICIVGVVVGRASATQIVPQMLQPLLVWCALWTVAGLRNAAPFALPTAYLYFAIPFWDALTEPLRSMTTSAVSVLVRWCGIPAFIDGNQIHIPSGTFEVAGGCSGLHFLIVGLALAALYGLLYYQRWLSRIVLAAVATVLAISANWLRVFALVAVGHVTDMQHYLIQVNHYYFGWLVFAVLMAPMFPIARMLERFEPAPTDRQKRVEGGEPHRGPVDPDVYSGVVRQGRVPLAMERPERRGAARLIPVVALALMAVGTAATYRISETLSRELSAYSVELPEAGSWQRDGDWSGSTRPIFVLPGAEAGTFYRKGKRRVGLYFADYPVQQQGRELVFYANRVQGESGRIVHQRRIRFAAGTLGSLPALELEVEEPRGERRLLWYTMRVAGRTTTHDVLAKLYQAFGVLAGRTDGRVVVLSAPCDDDCTPAKDSLSELAALVAPPLLTGREGQRE